MCFIWEDLDYFENKNYLETLSNKTFGDFYLKLFFLNWANPGLFLFFLVFSIQLTESTNKIWFKLWTSGVGNDFSSNWAKPLLSQIILVVAPL